MGQFREYSDRENASFVFSGQKSFPDASIRFLDAQRALDKSGGTGRPSNPYQIQRGYIRNLKPATLNKVKIHKCKFQFNPQEIRQSVNMREDIYNPVLLTAEQLSQPIGGNVNFQFDLLFDRSAQMAQAFNREPLITSQLFGASVRDSYLLPSKYGVFTDLNILYSVIGQGLSDDVVQQQIDNLQKTYEAKFKREQAYNSSDTTNTDDTKNTDTTTTQTSGNFYTDFGISSAGGELAGDVVNLLKSNMGNSAFLIPNPVRVVFSDLFMVDGFVTGTNVDFLKFNNLMIPMQCRVGISMNAVYIGFAKTNTFLSTTIATATQALQEEFSQDSVKSQQLLKALFSVGPFVLAFETRKDYTANNNLDEGTNWDRATNGNLLNNKLSYLIMPDDFTTREESMDSVDVYPIRTGYAGFKRVIPKAGDRNDIDAVLTLFESVGEASVQIDYNWSFTVYGMKDQNQNNGTGWTKSQADTIKEKWSDNKKNTSIVDKVAVYSGQETANSKESWGSGASGQGSGADKIRRRTYKELSNGASTALNFGQYKSNIENSYYIVEYEITIKAIAGSIPKDFISKIPVQVKSGNDPLTVAVFNYASQRGFNYGSL